ncbi:chorismate-binding protein [Pararhodonellum marinum]|uniref:chorismate-binding protein n=1 Tax=Pararhodonellum marinum TaxID=2755358 RepID=UPI00188FE74E|nr:chorismate-binding protein [Pararhodonellum marinum]
MEDILKEKLIDIKPFLDHWLYHAFRHGFGLAIWRKPQSDFLELAIDESAFPKKTKLNLEELPPGFIAHPFADQSDKKAHFVEATRYFKLNLDGQKVGSDLPEDTTHLEYNSLKTALKNWFKQPENHPEVHVENSMQVGFTQLVEKCMAHIEAGSLSKIVPAKIKKIPLKKDWEISSTLLELIKAYPNALVNFFHLPKVGTWMGASPEVLIRTKGDSFYTMSLAGTQKAKGDNPLKSVAWTQKEIEEQALVSRYIVDCFKKIRLREYDEQGPKTMVAGDLLHLRSDFRVDMKKTNFPQLGSVMLDLLHPTSAVCGTPRESAHQFIRENENFDRSFFAGFLGPVNIEQETHLYVNLRTAQLMHDSAILYAGAGVTEDSIPEKEWEETEMKCAIIGRFINPEVEF